MFYAYLMLFLQEVSIVFIGIFITAFKFQAQLSFDVHDYSWEYSVNKQMETFWKF